MDFNTEENRQILIDYFPRLSRDEHYKLLSDQTPIYNCIAWAMGLTDRWVDTLHSPGHWWPNGIAQNDSPDTLIAAFVAVGFEKVSDGNYEAGFDKVALFQKDGRWTHASRIESNDVEYSKFGGLFDGIHSHHAFSGSIYGDEYAYLRRLVSLRPLGFKKAKGTIHVNLENLKF